MNPKEIAEIFKGHGFDDYDFEKLSEDTYVMRTFIFDRRLFNELESYLSQSEIELVWEVKK